MRDVSESPYASIRDWAVVNCCEPGKEPHSHLVGWIVHHSHLDRGDPYIGTALSALDIEHRKARNASGKLISLIGDPLPGDQWHSQIDAMLKRAQREWRLPADTTWERCILAAKEG